MNKCYIFFLVACFGVAIQTTDVQCRRAHKPQPQTNPKICSLTAQREDFFKNVESFKAANEALKRLTKELDSNNDPKFLKNISQEPKHQAETLAEAKDLVGKGKASFDKLVDSIVRHRTRACEVCDKEVQESYNYVKQAAKSYEEGKRTAILNIKVDALLDKEVRNQVRAVANLAGTLEYLTDHPPTRNLWQRLVLKAEEKTKSKLLEEQKKLDDLISKTAGRPEMMADAVKQYKCES